MAQKRSKVMPISEDSLGIEQINPIPFRSILKSNPFPMLWGVIPFSSEYRLNIEFVNGHHQSSEFGFAFLGKSPVLSWLERDSMLWNIPGQLPHFKVRGFRIQAMHKFFLSGFREDSGKDASRYAPEGAWIAPHISYATVNISSPILNMAGLPFDAYMNISHFNVNLLGGYQLRVANRKMFDFYIGMGYKKNIWIEVLSPNGAQRSPLQEEFYDFYNGSLKLMLGLNAGIGFGQKYMRTGR